MTHVDFSVLGTFDRNLFWEGGESVRYLVARIKARRKDDPAAAERTPLNIALVIDASGSMGGGKLEAAKAAALGLADRLTERDRLTVVSFASDIQVHLDAVAVTADNAAIIRTEVSRLETRGMTCLSGGWFAGVECAARIAEQDPRMAARIIILSDGHANEGIVNPEQLREHAGELRMRGILTSCLGIGDGYDEHLLRGIAENGGGRLHDAELTSEISSVLLGELDDIFGTVVEDVQITLGLPNGMKVEGLGRGNIEFRAGSLVAPLGPVQNDVDRIAVFKIVCPRARSGHRFQFQIIATGRVPDTGAMLSSGPGILELVAVDGVTNQGEVRNLANAEIVARTWSAHVVSMASRMNRDGAYQDAERFINGELRHFRRYVEDLDRGPEMIRNLELLARHAGRQFSPRMSKEMLLQSSLTLEGRIDRRGSGKAAWSARMERGD